jgi:hypothetical protein
MKTKIVILAFVLVLFLSATGVALANSNLILERWVLGGGASDSAAGDVSLRATLGQPVVGVVSTEDISLGQGLWHGGSLPGGGNDIYLPFVLK